MPIAVNCDVDPAHGTSNVGSGVFLDTTFADISNIGISTGYPKAQPAVIIDRLTATGVKCVAQELIHSVYVPALTRSICVPRYLIDAQPGPPAGKTQTIKLWRQGRCAPDVGKAVCDPAKDNGNLLPVRPDAPMESRSLHPLFPNGTSCDKGSCVANILDFGATGAGSADDTKALSAALATKKPVFLPSGTYQISATVALPDGAVLIGEVWSLIVAMPGAAAFKSNASVAPMLQTSSGGSVQLVNLMIGTLPGSGKVGAPPAKGDSPGVQLLDWRSGAKASAFDVHFRVYGDAYGMLKLEGGAGGETRRSVQSACLCVWTVLSNATH